MVHSADITCNGRLNLYVDVMKYILTQRYALRGWRHLPYALADFVTDNVTFLSKERFLLLYHCDGAYELSYSALTQTQIRLLDEYTAAGVVAACTHYCSLTEKQRYRLYPARFKEAAQWSVTGRCNLRCRHCFMSASKGALGEPTLDECMSIIDQLSECGVRKVSLTGGEPLIRRDFWEIADALREKDIKLTTVFSNGLLVNNELLNGFEARGMRPQFQFSFDGTGCHDWLRGLDGAESRLMAALTLCRERGFVTSAAMCLNRRNAGSIRESVKLLARHGCSGLKVNNTAQAGEWLNERDEYLSDDECFKIYMEYIPQYFEDGTPLDLMLDGMFVYHRDDKSCAVPFEHDCSEGGEASRLLCAHIRREFYISPKGMILPCMSMAGSAVEKQFPNMLRTPLKEILGDSEYMSCADKRLDEYLRHNQECSDCDYSARCGGGCRASAVGSSGEDYLAPDLKACAFFKNGWADKIKERIDGERSEQSIYSQRSEA